MYKAMAPTSRMAIPSDPVADGTNFGTASGPITRTFAVRNTGNADLTISSINSSNPAFVAGAPSSSIVLAGTSVSFEVVFTSNGDAVQNATITINSDDASKGEYDFVVKWSLPPPCSASSATLSSSSATIAAGATANLTVAIYGGTAPYTLVYSGGTVTNTVTNSYQWQQYSG